MSDDARRPLTEEERARLQAARMSGGTCAGCGRALAAGKPVWWERFDVCRPDGTRSVIRWAAVGRECASPSLVRGTGVGAPARCLGCGRGVHLGPITRPRAPALCSPRCRRAYEVLRMVEGLERAFESAPVRDPEDL